MSVYFLTILFLSLLVVPIYYKAKRFDGFWGVSMFVLGFTALLLRLLLSRSFPILGLFNYSTLGSSIILILAPALVFVFFGVYSGHFKRRLKRLEKLMVPYILFGGLQQVFFFVVFSDTVYYLTKNFILTFAATMVFFVMIHLNWTASVRKYWFLLGIFAMVNTWIYLVWGNILPQVLVHGIVGSVLFTDFTDTNQLKLRTGRG